MCVAQSREKGKSNSGLVFFENQVSNSQDVYLTFNREHNGSFGAITNADGIEKLKSIYGNGMANSGIGHENSVYTGSF